MIGRRMEITAFIPDLIPAGLNCLGVVGFVELWAVHTLFEENEGAS